MVIDEMRKHIEDLRKREKAQREMQVLEKAHREAKKKFTTINKDASITIGEKSTQMADIKQSSQALITAINTLSVPDDLYEERDKLISKLTELMSDADNNIAQLPTYPR